MKILLIEDDELLSDILKALLEKKGFFVDVASDGEEGLWTAEYPHDAIVLDIILPSIDGLTVLKTLRKKMIKTPVLLLTTRGTVQDRIQGLDLGADDYLTKPFDYNEFLARLRALIRRGKGEASPIKKIGDLEVDSAAKTVKRSGRVIALTSREFNLLEYLALNSGKVISRAELIEHLYDSEFESDSNIIDVYITYLRSKIDKHFPDQMIHTVRGAGYIMKCPESK